MKPRIVSVKSADRVLDLLELLARRGKALSHTELSVALGIPKSSLTQLLRNLTDRGYLAFSPGPNTYEPGAAFFALLRRAQEGFNIVALARPVLAKLTAATHESSSFNAYRRDYVERLCGVDSPQALTYRMTIGTRFMLYSSSAGKAVLAALPEPERNRYFDRVRLEQRTEATVKSVAELRRQVARIAREGVAYSRGEYLPGIVAIAAAIRRPDGYPLGALNVVTPAIRFDPALEATCLRELKAAQLALERELHASLAPAAAAAAESKRASRRDAD
jgi:IclR family transcriptional regulator, acetate operon repressor